MSEVGQFRRANSTFRNGSKPASGTGMASKLSSRRSRPTTAESPETMANSYSEGGEN